MNRFMARRRALLAAPGGGFPVEPSAYNDLIGTYNSSTTFVAPENGYYEIQLFGASGSGGASFYYGNSQSSYSNGDYGTTWLEWVMTGGGGGGGGCAVSRVMMKKGDTVALTIGYGTCRATVSTTVVGESYSQMVVTSGSGGGAATKPTSSSGSGGAVGAGGAGGVASGGNYSNKNGGKGGAGGSYDAEATAKKDAPEPPREDNATTTGSTYTFAGGAAGSPGQSGGRSGGTGQNLLATVRGLRERRGDITWYEYYVLSYVGGAGQNGFCRIYRGNTNFVQGG